jgi:hypothetical protein
MRDPASNQFSFFYHLSGTFRSWLAGLVVVSAVNPAQHEKIECKPSPYASSTSSRKRGAYFAIDIAEEGEI